MNQTKKDQEKSPAAPIRKGDELDVTIASLAYGGQGVARHEGFVVFVAKGEALPEARQRVQIIKKRRGFAEARTVTTIQPSPYEIEPLCAHFGQCGGCATQNLDYAEQLKQKQAQVLDLFVRMGRFTDPDVRRIVGCQETFNYRNKMEFAFSQRTWVPDPADIPEVPETALGLHVRTFHDRILNIDECWIQHPTANAVLNTVRNYCREQKLEPYDQRKHTGYLRYLMLRLARAYTDSPQIMVNLVTSRATPALLKPLAEQLTAEFPAVVSVLNNINSRKGDTAIGEQEIILAGRPTISERLRGLNFDISANSFFQTNTRQADVLYALVEEACALTGNETIYDLYCGTGTIGLSLAKKARRVAGFELNESAVDDASRNALINEIFNARFFLADLNGSYFTRHGKRLSRDLDPPDLVIVDPPRAGLHPRLIEELTTLAPPRIVYVSCNPATQARDVRLLVDSGFQLRYMQPVDMFPHTPHIENICVLEK